MDSAEEIRTRVEAVDRAVRDGDPVPSHDLKINVTSTFRRHKWGDGIRPSALTRDALAMLGMQDRTYDKRWVLYFENRANDVAIYRSTVGMYWLLRYDPAMGEHWFVHLGTAATVNSKYGTGG